MKKISVICALCLAVAGIGFAEVTAPVTAEAVNARRAARKAAIQARIAKDGGMVYGRTPGTVVRLVNAQKSVDGATVEAVAEAIRETVQCAVEVVACDTPKACAFQIARDGMSDGKAGAVVALVEDAKLPTLVTMPEDFQSIVNVSRLVAGAQGDVAAQRLRKEIWRAVAYALGAANSTVQPCVMRPITKPDDLDTESVAIVSPEPLMKIMNTLTVRGVSSLRSASYKRACEQGWAPAPTNEFQRAIWQQFNPPPTNPILITK